MIILINRVIGRTWMNIIFRFFKRNNLKRKRKNKKLRINKKYSRFFKNLRITVRNKELFLIHNRRNEKKKQTLGFIRNSKTYRHCGQTFG